MHLFTNAPGAPFLDTLVALWRSRTTDAGRKLHDGLILLPTRRAARELAAGFLRAAAGAPLLLPRIIALGGLDEAPLALAGALDLPPAIAPAHRLAVLAKLILAMGGSFGAPLHADRAWTLAGELAVLMDEAERAEIDLATGLRNAADPAHALHWEKTLEFLTIVTRAWPDYLAEQGLMNPAARQVALLRAQAAAWIAAPPDFPVLAVGNAGDIPAVGALLRAAAGLAQGLVMLPGLDLTLPDADWERLDAAHPQSGLRDLLAQLHATRGDVAEIGAPAIPAGRAALLRLALLPADGMAQWRTPFTPQTEGLCLLAPADAQEEAVCIAMVLRGAVEDPSITAALVTPDRALAERVRTELARYGIVADDSAGEPLADTPPATFLRLIARAIDQDLAPVALLAVLKHPFCALGLAPAEARRHARKLERACLRGPRPDPGLAGLRRAVALAAARRHGMGFAAEDDPVSDLLARLESCLEPSLRAAKAVAIPPADLLAALVRSAEACAATDAQSGPEILWSLEEGEASARLLAEVQDALPVLPEDRPACLPGLLDAVLSGAVVRSRRATRGRGGAEHPRISIWGLLEARLQTAGLIVLGGLVDGVWPQATDPGPWMSRPMRIRAGLPSPELRIGQAAHDFCMAACAAPRVVLSAPRRRDGAPAVPSRWLTRLNALLADHGGIPAHPAAAWAALLDQPLGPAAPAAPPRPCPPVANRPQGLSVTEIATLLVDPYAIHARRILRLKPLDPLEQWADFRDYGNIVHRGLDAFLEEVKLDWPAAAAWRITEKLAASLRDGGVREALIAWWSPRLARIADWVDEEERRRRFTLRPTAIRTEAEAEWVLARPHGPFALRGRADRLEAREDGSIAIYDYKTGAPPSQARVEQGLAPQLLLEAAMARAGVFGAELAGPTGELIYWHLNGGHTPGKARPLFKGDRTLAADAVDAAQTRLAVLIDLYADPRTTYLAQPNPGHALHGSDYAQLARIPEWGSAAQDDPIEDALDEQDTGA